MSSRVRYGILGTGLMGHEHIRNLALLPEAELVAYADPDPKSRWWTRQLVAPEVAEYADARELLREAKLDAVVVATPNHTHHEILQLLLGTQLHILVEKPLCTTVEDAKRVADAAARHPGVFWVGMEYRYMPPLARLVEAVGAGAVGRLRMLAIREHRMPFLSKVGDWNRFARNTGGTFVEKCCHFFDLMRLITASEPVRVYASAGQDVNHLDEEYAGERPDILDNGYVVLDFASGARALLDLCMFAEASRNEQEVVATGDAGKLECFVPESLFVVGTRSPKRVETHAVETDARALAAGTHFGATYTEHQRFLAAVREGKPAEVSAEDGLRAVAMGAAAELSVAERRPVEMAELL